MSARATYVYRDGKWVDKRSVPAAPRPDTFYFTVRRGEYNHSLGCYTGSSQDIKDACSKIEDQTGERPIEIGDQRVKHQPQREDYL